MFITYFDETGDDGFPGSSKLFVLTSIYIHHQNWKQAHESVSEFRRVMRVKHGLPTKFEIHTKSLLLNKNPYRSLGLDDEVRKEIALTFAQVIGSLNIEAVNVIIDKNKITDNGYPILDRALTYNIQRVETGLKNIDPQNRFIIVTDEGRLAPMRKTAREIQRVQFMPSHFGGYYRNEIQLLVEDILAKESKESHFI